MQRWQKALEDLRSNHLYRSTQHLAQNQLSSVVFQNKSYINFSSNNYLGLTHHPQMIAASTEALQQFGTGTGASRLVTGSLDLHRQLEESLAAFKKTPAALLFNSGFQANTTVIPTLAQDGDVIFSDELNHASLIDGCRLAKATKKIFSHNDLNHLESLLVQEHGKRLPQSQFFIVTESVFSMDGDRCHLASLHQLAQKYHAIIYIDEAHATGIFGAGGAGLVEECGLSGSPHIIQMGTFSKALGSFGAYVCGSQALKDYLINLARGFIFTTSLPAAVVAANLQAIDLVKQEPHRRVQLHENITLLSKALRQWVSEGPDALVKVPQGFGESAILPVILGPEERTLQVSKHLFNKGIWAQAIRPPTVPTGTSRIRFTITADHNQGHVNSLLSALQECQILNCVMKSE